MKYKYLAAPLFYFVMLFISCLQTQQDNLSISKEEMLKIAKENGNKFSIGYEQKMLLFLQAFIRTAPNMRSHFAIYLWEKTAFKKTGKNSLS